MFEGYFVVFEDGDQWLYATDMTEPDHEGYPVRCLGDTSVSVTEVIGAIWEHKNEAGKL
jgi:hypothetical protein